MPRAFSSVVIENLQPLIDGGRYPVKRVVGEDLVVDADIFKDGHDVVAAVLKWRVLGKRTWRETPMAFVDNDRWRGACTLYDNAIHEYTVEAWTDTFRSWQLEFTAKFVGGISALRSEAMEGAALVRAAARRAHEPADAARLLEFAEQISTAANSEINAIAQSGELEVLMATYPDRSNATQYDPVPSVVVERPAALIGAWYEFFPRSAEGRGDRGSTFRDCLPRIDDAKAMGFDVIYFPPIHPIGHTIGKDAIMRSHVSQATRASRGQSAVKRADTKLSSLHSGHWPISTGFKNRCENAEWKSRSTSLSIVHPITLRQRASRLVLQASGRHD